MLSNPPYLKVGSGPRHDIAVAEPLQVAGGGPGGQVAGRNPLKGKPESGINASDTSPQPIIRFPYAARFEGSASCLEVGMTGPVILGRAGRTPLPKSGRSG